MKPTIRHGLGIAAYTIGFLWLFYATFTHAMRYDHRPHPPGWRESLLHVSETIAYGGFLKPARWLSGAGGPIFGPDGRNRGPIRTPASILFVPLVALAYGGVMHLFALSLMNLKTDKKQE